MNTIKQTSQRTKIPLSRLWLSIGAIIIGIPIVVSILLVSNAEKISKILSGQAANQGVDLAHLGKVIQDAANGSSTSVKIGDIVTSKLPTDFPQEFPILPSARVVGAEKKTTSAAIIFDATFSVDKKQVNSDSIFEWYTQQLQAKKWSIQSTTESTAKKNIEATLQTNKANVFITNSILSAEEMLITVHIEQTK